MKPSKLLTMFGFIEDDKPVNTEYELKIAYDGEHEIVFHSLKGDVVISRKGIEICSAIGEIQSHVYIEDKPAKVLLPKKTSRLWILYPNLPVYFTCLETYPCVKHNEQDYYSISFPEFEELISRILINDTFVIGFNDSAQVLHQIRLSKIGNAGYKFIFGKNPKK